MEKRTTELSKIFDNQFNQSIKEQQINILMDRLANEWLEIAKKIPNPKPLFGNIIHEGEVAILFANTGVGKSILSVQIADGISKGKSILNLETASRKVLYCDFELSTKALQLRYSDENGNLYCFSDNFIRIEIDRKKSLETESKSLEELIFESIAFQVEKHEPQVLIIDNITFTSANNEKGKEAGAIMKLILNLSRQRNLTILLIAHTPKRDIFKPIQLEDLAGSKALSNFADVVFCIGESIKSPDIRYIKELKNRNYPIVFHRKNVIECRLVKEDCFLQFKFSDFNYEEDHLISIKEDSEDKIDEILELRNEGKSNVEIGKIIGVSESAIRRRITKFQKKIQ